MRIRPFRCMWHRGTLRGHVPHQLACWGLRGPLRVAGACVKAPGAGVPGRRGSPAGACWLQCVRQLVDHGAGSPWQDQPQRHSLGAGELLVFL